MSLPAKVMNAKGKPRLLWKNGVASFLVCAAAVLAASTNAVTEQLREREDTEDLILHLSLDKKEFDESIQLFWNPSINLKTKTIQN